MVAITMTVKDVAEYLGVHHETILKNAREKKIPCFHVGRRVLFRKEVIDKWIEAQEEKSQVM